MYHSEISRFYVVVQIHFNGTEEKMPNSTAKGRYENIFTGFCCPGQMSARRRRQAASTEGQHFITKYEVLIFFLKKSF